MEKCGYVLRRRKRGNRKRIYIHLTRAGRVLESKLTPLAIEVNDIATVGLSKKQIDEFRNALIKIVTNLNATTALA